MKSGNPLYMSLFWSFVLGFAVATGCAADRADEILFSAMQDELQRSMTDLVIEDLEQPYFLSYMIDDFQELTIRGTLGTLTESGVSRSRYLTVDLHVGDRSLDNSNFIGGYYISIPDFSRLAIENDYDAIRNGIYLTTDEVYKSALKNLSKKRAYLQTRVIKDRPDDLAELPAGRYSEEPEALDLSEAVFRDRIREASRVFREYPAIAAAGLVLKAVVANQYYLTSAGSRSLRGDRLYSISLDMSGKGPDGEDIVNTDQIIVDNPADVPGTDALVAWARDNAERMNALLKAETVDGYTGPVILVGDGAGEFFRQLFAKNVSDLPMPLVENERLAAMMPEPQFGTKLKRRVLPAFFDVYDDPTLARINGADLIGTYGIDDAGVAPERVQLVDKGKLVNLLVGVAPTKKIKKPNGHARCAVGRAIAARPGNLIFESGDHVSYERLKEAMLELCRDSDMEYGLVITRLENPNAPRRAGSFFMSGGTGNQDNLTPPLEAYKVYLDGREEPVQGLEFGGVTVRTLRDILQTDDRPYVYNYLIGDDFEMPVSVVCPAVLVEEMELKRSQAKTTKPPVLPSPLAEN